MLLKCCTQYVTKFEKLNNLHRTGKKSVIIPISKKGNAKERSSYHTTEFTSHATKVMHNILQARLQQYLVWELPNIQSEFRKGSGTRDQIAIIGWNMEKEKEFQKKKKSISVSLTMLKSLTVWIIKHWKILKEMGIPDHLTCLLRTSLQVKKHQLD